MSRPDLRGVPDDPQFLADVIAVMAQVPLFAGLTAEQRLAVARQGELVYYEPRDRLFRQGDPGDELHIVLDGEVHLVSQETAGVHRVAVKTPGTSFGEISFISGSRRTLTALAGNRGAFDLTLTRRALEVLTVRDPGIGLGILREVLDGVQDRIGTLPRSFRDYLMWGYRPSTEELGRVPLARTLPVRPFTVLAGILAALAGAWFTSRASANWALASRTGVMIVTIGALLGALVGMIGDRIEDRRRRLQPHPRSCASCRFVVWDEATGRHGCMYRTEGHRQVAVDPGVRPETYTACSAFDLDGREPRTRRMKRDEMGKD